MDETESRLLAKWQISPPPRYSTDRIQYLLKAEEQILQSISVRAPISNILNDICSALDRQIGNMISLICIPANSAISAAEASRSAAHFGLHVFCSAVIGDESEEALGSLEMYCYVSRNPSPREFQLIERAACLAAVAIKCQCRTGDGANWRSEGVRSARGHVSEMPTSMN